MIETLLINQNSDGGFPYRRGGSSWTEPTAFALLAGYASGDTTGRARGLQWLRSMQRSDGGYAPTRNVAQSTWVTALAALFPPNDLGAAAHKQAIRWLLGQTAANATFMFRMQCWLNRTPFYEPYQGWEWLPGTAAWATPTSLAILALAKEDRRNPDPALKSRILSARRFLLEHRCSDGGWNHGSVKSLGVDAPSYPETTGTALLALAGPTLDATAMTSALNRAEAWWSDCQSCEAAGWLMLGLRANGRAKSAIPEKYKPRSIQDAAISILASSGDRGSEIFLA